MKRTSAALTAWTQLNDRQQGTLGAIYAIDQDIEATRRGNAARGDWSSIPAAVWRRIDFTHEPSLRELLGPTELQARLLALGWDNQGNGSTMVALASRGLITRDVRGTAFGIMHTVTLTRAGRAAARAGLSLATGPVKVALSARAWEVLALLWAAGLKGEPLNWGYSGTIENVLIGKHLPALARSVGGGYEITERGKDFYREHYAAHTGAHPSVHAPHPDGVQAEPWPPRADEILTHHRQYYRALCAAWQIAHDQHEAAEREAAADPPVAAPMLPAAVNDMITARHRLWRDTARQRAQLAAAHAEDLHTRGDHAARGYAAAALIALHAAVTATDPLTGLREPQDRDTWDEPRLAPPAETGIHAIDAHATKLHAAAVGAPLRRRGPAPKHRPRRWASARPPQPGAALAALADFLHEHTHGGTLLRRLHR